MKTVLITGGAKGIGGACAETFAACGYNVVVDYLSSAAQAEALAARIKEKYGVGALAFRADVTSSREVDALFSAAEKAFGGVDALVNNAGISLIKPINDTSEQEWDDIFAVNVKSAYLAINRALPYMIDKKSGAIVNVSSVWGLAGASCEAAYSASKAALIGFTKALAKELGLSGIRVNCVCPGVIETDMNAALGEDVKKELAESAALNRLGGAEEVAETVRFLAEATFVTGQCLAADGGFL
ncbi:MAG: 3-oxoacyl-ACP reductase [Bacillota bacterium]|nr:MAG: 3-oxoacyl-ACP reductase [Bacillota bacterium]